MYYSLVLHTRSGLYTCTALPAVAGDVWPPHAPNPHAEL